MLSFISRKIVESLFIFYGISLSRMALLSIQLNEFLNARERDMYATVFNNLALFARHAVIQTVRLETVVYAIR